MDGIQTPGINYNSIDGLTTVNATTISINGSTINLDSYIPYVGAVSNPDFNTRRLTNIGNAINPQDAVAFNQLNSFTQSSIVNGSTSVVCNAIGDIENRFSTIVNIANSVICSAETQTNKILFGQAITLYTPQPTPLICGFINPNSAGVLDVFGDTTLNLSGGTTLRVTAPTVFIDGTISSNGSQIKNIADGTLNSDAITLQQLNNKRYDTIQNGAADVFVNCGLNDLTLQAGPIGKIEIGSLIDCNSNTISNLAAAINAGDAVRFDQLPAALPGATVQGSYVIYNGTSYINNSTNSVNLGAYSNATATSSVNIGAYAGAGNDALDSLNVNVGQSTGSSGQTSQATAVGAFAGAVNQGAGNVAIGYSAQKSNSALFKFNSVHIGALAGFENYGKYCVGIGYEAGEVSHGDYAVAIGSFAGRTNQSTNTIIINATGADLNSAVSTATYIAPLRITTSDNSSTICNKVVQYDTLTKELRYSGTTIFNVIVIGLPSTTTPVVSFMPTGFPIDLFGFTFTCTVVRNSIGDYTLTFPASSGPNLLTATITTGVNALITSPIGGSKIVTAIATGANTIRINYVFANVAFTDLAGGEFISLRIEFTTL